MLCRAIPLDEAMVPVFYKVYQAAWEKGHSIENVFAQEYATATQIPRFPPSSRRGRGGGTFCTPPACLAQDKTGGRGEE